MLYEVIIAYPGNWNNEKQKWNDNERTIYDTDAVSEDAATAIIQKKIDDGELNASIVFATDFAQPHEIEPHIIKTIKSEDNE